MEFVIPPPPPDDPRRRVRFRETAVEWLRQTSRFGRVSRRLLSDLLDVADHHDLRPPSPRRSFSLPGIALLIVLEGEVTVRAGGAPSAPGGGPPEARFVRREGERRAQLPPGVYLGGDRGWATDDRLRIMVTNEEGAYVVAVSRSDMVRWLRASPTLLHSVGFPEGYQELVGDVDLFGEELERGRT